MYCIRTFEFDIIGLVVTVLYINNSCNSRTFQAGIQYTIVLMIEVNAFYIFQSIIYRVQCIAIGANAYIQRKATIPNRAKQQNKNDWKTQTENNGGRTAENST